ncbi:hypothetical protein [Pyruvatibacter sp.]
MSGAAAEADSGVVRKSELARRWGLSGARITQLTSGDGYLRPALTDDNKVDLAKAIELRRVNEDPANAKTKNVDAPAPDEPSGDVSTSANQAEGTPALASERVYGEQLKNQQRAIDIEKQAGRLIDRDETWDTLMGPLSQLFADIRALPKNLRTKLVADGVIQSTQGEDFETTAHVAAEKIIDKLRAALQVAMEDAPAKTESR